MSGTTEELNDKLSEEIAWRKRELGAIKSLVRSQNSFNRKKKALIRSGVTVLYAHWEGFVKKSASEYLKFLKRRRLTYDVLSKSLVALGSRNEIGQAAKTDSNTKWKEVVGLFIENMDNVCNLPERVDTKSNLNSDRFRDIVVGLGLDYSDFSTSEKIIDIRLVDNRNKIAHGEYLDIDTELYLDLQKRVISLMDKLMNEIVNSAVQKRYRR